MQKNKNIQKQILIFSKWSRKGYAVFASLGKVVTIAHLKVEICKQAIKKNINLLETFILIEKNKLDEKVGEVKEQLLSEWLLQNVLFVENTNSASNPIVNIIKRDITKIRPESSGRIF